MKIARTIKAHDPNVNTNTIINNLEEHLRQFIDSNSHCVFVDDAVSDINDIDVFNKFETDLNRVAAIVYEFDDEYFYLTVTDYGKSIFKIEDDRLITNYTMGIVYMVDESKSNCTRIIKLSLIKKNEKENENDQSE